MKLYTLTPKTLKPSIKIELENYRLEYSKGNLQTAWQHLERAHILGQKYPLAHCHVHWKMLQFACKVKNRKEILSQIPRLLLGGPFSFVGKVPIGNPGGSNVHPLKTFPIEKELLDILNKAEKKLP